MSSKRVRVKVRREVVRVRGALADLWASSVDPVDRLVCRCILRTDMSPEHQMRLLRAWFAYR